MWGRSLASGRKETASLLVATARAAASRVNVTYRNSVTLSPREVLVRWGDSTFSDDPLDRARRRQVSWPRFAAPWRRSVGQADQLDRQAERADEIDETEEDQLEARRAQDALHRGDDIRLHSVPLWTSLNGR
jgi:hypothetical protein